MCGILGVWNRGGAVDLRAMERSLSMLRHRGPDDEGYLLAATQEGRRIHCGGKDTRDELGLSVIHRFFDQKVDLALGFRRLSILDLSASGHQPMSNEDESVWVVHNGEIYNYIELRKQLEGLGHSFLSKTDTEVILHAYEEWGTDCVRSFNGMWSFAIVDLKKNRIFCSRDRAGVKPFYYVSEGRRFAFASEIKALLALDGIVSRPNDQIIADYLFSGLLDHTEETFFKNIYQLRPGQYLLIENQEQKIRSYWDIEPREVRFSREENYAQQFEKLFEDSIRLRLRSDVPIGTCLSGGLDSSSIVCMANRMMFEGNEVNPRLIGEKQKTFSSCFEDPVYDERRYIEMITRQTNAENNYVFPSGESLNENLADLVWHQDEPFDSTSIYAQWDVMRLAGERGVTVLLDGQGGDELLGGYLTSFYYLFVQSLKHGDLRGLVKEMRGYRNKHRNGLNPLIKTVWSSMISTGIKHVFRRGVGRRMEWAEKGFRKKYLRTFQWPSKFETDLDNYLYHIFRFLTLPRLLHSEDRNSMAFSLETRLPFLDFRLVEYVFSLPSEQKIKEGVTKVVLRNAMRGILPEEVRSRHDKMGFVTPEDIWFKTVLKDKIYEVIGSRSFSDRGYFVEEKVKGILDQHCRGKMNASSLIWRWVNLELWFRTFVDER